MAGIPGGVMYQVSLLQALTQGDYDGSVSVRALKTKGDTGLGTFDRLNGEMIMLDGRVYRADGEGRAEEVSDDETTPFAVVTHFDEREKAALGSADSLDDLISQLDEMYAGDHRNYFQVVKVRGTFEKMKVRSFPAQKKPYRPLKEVMDAEQRIFDCREIPGTAVGVYCPVYMGGMNFAGWHFHFISDDRSRGGHVLDLALEEGELRWAGAEAVQVDLPDEGPFSSFDFSIDRSEDVRKVESLQKSSEQQKGDGETR